MDPPGILILRPQRRPHDRNAGWPGSSSDPAVRQARHARGPSERPHRGRSRRA